MCSAARSFIAGILQPVVFVIADEGVEIIPPAFSTNKQYKVALESAKAHDACLLRIETKIAVPSCNTAVGDGSPGDRLHIEPRPPVGRAFIRGPTESDLEESLHGLGVEPDKGSLPSSCLSIQHKAVREIFPKPASYMDACNWKMPDHTWSRSHPSSSQDWDLWPACLSAAIAWLRTKDHRFINRGHIPRSCPGQSAGRWGK